MTKPNDLINPITGISKGLTKREYFTAMALMGFANSRGMSIDEMVELAINLADATIAGLNKPETHDQTNKKGLPKQGRW